MDKVVNSETAKMLYTHLMFDEETFMYYSCDENSSCTCKYGVIYNNAEILDDTFNSDIPDIEGKAWNLINPNTSYGYGNNKHFRCIFSAPTLNQVQNWLYSRYNVFVTVLMIYINSEQCFVAHIIHNGNDITTDKNIETFKKIEDALDYGIEEAVKYLIK